MKYGVAAWNAGEAFGDTERQAKAIEHLKPHVAQGMGLIAINEVCRENGIPPDEVMGGLGDFASREGYQLFKTSYDDEHPRINQPADVQQFMAVLVSGELDQTSEVVRLATRNALFVTARLGDGTSVQGVLRHNEDRRESTRLLQDNAVLALMKRGQNSPGVDLDIADHNSLPRNAGRSWLWRAVGLFTGFTGVPPEGPPPDRTAWVTKLQRADSVLMRASAMAQGGTLIRMAADGFIDADPAQQPTHLLGQTDRCLYRYRGGIEAAPPVFELGDKGPSDHKSIQVTFEW